MKIDNFQISDTEIRNKLDDLCDRMLRYISLDELMIIKMFKPATIAFVQKPLPVNLDKSYEKIEFAKAYDLCDSFLSETHSGLQEKLKFLNEIFGGIQPDSDHTMAYPLFSMIKLKLEHNFIDVANLMHENTHMKLEWKVYPRVLQEIAPIVVETLALQYLLNQNKQAEQMLPMRAVRINECNNYAYSVISLIEMCELAGINISEEGLNADAKEKLNIISLPENRVAFYEGITKLQEVIYERGFEKNRSLNLNHYIGTIIGAYLAEKVKTKEIDLDTIFSVLTNLKLRYKQKLNELGITEDLMPILISNLYKYTECELNKEIDYSLETNFSVKKH